MQTFPSLALMSFSSTSDHLTLATLVVTYSDLKGTPLVALELKQSGEKEAGFLTSDARRVLSSRQQRSAVTPRFD